FIQANGWSIDTTMDGGIIYGGENYWLDPLESGKTEESGMVCRLDSQGNNLWWDFVYNSGCTHIYSIRQLSQGGYIAAGQAWTLENGTQGILIKYAPETGIESSDVSPTVEISEISPNPFFSNLNITCNLPEQTNASLTVYDLGGRIVDVAEAGSFPAGEHTVQWIPSEELSAGCYLIRLQTDTGRDVRNCVYLD
ncbi:MAG: T9SS type A sorting domain-containing protein, partial [Candidatus Sabulitectum sp.]|nr:T9SS type A sorting domain-containing protein [Candidatus Sabulitectum sp.]